MTYIEAVMLKKVIGVLLNGENVALLDEAVLMKLENNYREFVLDAEDLETTKQVILSQCGHKITRPDGTEDIVLANEDDSKVYAEALGAFAAMEVDHDIEKLTEAEFEEFKTSSGFDEEILEKLNKLIVDHPAPIVVKKERKVRNKKKSLIK